MSQIAFVSDTLTIYWSAIVLAIAVLAAALAMLGCRALQGELPWDMALFLPLAILLGVLGARLLHYHCFYRQYADLHQALTDDSVGSFCLAGAFLGVLLAALILWGVRVIKKLPSFMDAVAPGAALGIAVGKLSAIFYSANRGKVVFEKAFYQGLPFSTDMEPITGVPEFRAAVFFWQSLAAFLIFFLLLLTFFRNQYRKEKQPDGSVFSLFLRLWCAAELIFDSMRYDSAFFRINGFVSVVQILSLAGLVFELVLYSVRGIKRSGFRPANPACWALSLLGIAALGVGEYLVQRHGDWYLACYAMMSAGALAVLISIRILQKKSFSEAPEETEAPVRTRKSEPAREPAAGPWHDYEKDQYPNLAMANAFTQSLTSKLPKIAVAPPPAPSLDYSLEPDPIIDEPTSFVERLTSKLPKIPNPELSAKRDMEETRRLIADLLPTDEEDALFRKALEEGVSSEEKDDSDWLKDLDRLLENSD